VSVPLAVSVSTDAGLTTIALAGDLDIDGVSLLVAQVELVAVGQRICIDLGEVAFIDSSGVGVLVQLKRRHDREGRDLRIANATGHPRNVFTITGLDELLER
jgi:anti-anti-sigma factor